MKKILTLLIFMITTIFAFADTIVVNVDEKPEQNDLDFWGLSMNGGIGFYDTNRLNMYDNLSANANNLQAYGWAGELGLFKSAEDDIFDIVESHHLGLAGGRVDCHDKYQWQVDNKLLSASEDASFGNFYFKDLYGVQMNALVISLGAMIGQKVGFDWMTLKGTSALSESFEYKEKRIFLDFVWQPYFSVNIKPWVKLMFSAEYDLPVFRARFVKEAGKDYYGFRWNWFRNDIPSTYSVGFVLFI